jgi:hypothetical protein
MSSFDDINMQYEPIIPPAPVGHGLSPSSTSLSACQILEKVGILVFDTTNNQHSDQLLFGLAVGDPSNFLAPALSIEVPTIPGGSNINMDGQDYPSLEALFDPDPFSQFDDSFGTFPSYLNLSENPTLYDPFDLQSCAKETEVDEFQNPAISLSYYHGDWTRMEIDAGSGKNAHCQKLLFDAAVPYTNQFATREFMDMTEHQALDNRFLFPANSFVADGMMDEVPQRESAGLNNRPISELFENQIQSFGEVSDRPRKRSCEASAENDDALVVSVRASSDDRCELQPIKKRMLSPFKSTKLILGRRINKVTLIKGNNTEGRKGTFGCATCRKRKRKVPT